MKIILLSGSIYSIPAMHFFAGQKMIQAVASVGNVDNNIAAVEQNAGLLNLPYRRFSKNQLAGDFKSWLIEMQPDIALVFGFRYKLPEELFDIPKSGFFNVHFSLLPAYRGKNPVFWQLKNGDSRGGITIHKIAKEYDTGPILVQKEIAVFQGENNGILSGRLSLESTGVIAEAIEKLKQAGGGILTEQEGESSYCSWPSADDLTIKWETQSAKEIESLVNASNPDYGGAVTTLRGQPIRILEVNPAEINNPAEFSPGTIVHTDLNYGVFVACKNLQFLRVNVVQSPEGILSGFKLVSLGLRAGERFESSTDIQMIMSK